MVVKYKSEINNEIGNVIKGINYAANVIISTMGGSGKNVVIADNNDNMLFTKDGVSVAKKIRLSNHQENIGAQLLINAAKKTVNECGDGTTLTSLFVKEFTNALFGNLQENPNIDINQMLDEIRESIDLITQEIIEKSKKIKSTQDIYNVAFTSCKNAKLANFIKNIYEKTGFDANISIELSRTSNHTYYELTEGLNFESGVVHQSFLDQKTNTCVFENCLIVNHKENITSYEEFSLIFEECYNNKIPLVIIAPSFSDAFIRMCITNKIQKGFEICLVKTPGYGKGVIENTRDIISFIGRDSKCNRFVANSYEFTIFNQTDKDKIKNRVQQLQKLAENAVEKYDELDYLNRISRLKQTSAIIYVGGITEANAKEEYDRIEDAIGAIKSSLKLGYVRGAGVELANITSPVNSQVKDILKKPYFQILQNANIKTETISEKPFNTRTKQYDDNIIDSSHILINAIVNAFALVELLINTSYIIYNDDTK